MNRRDILKYATLVTGAAMTGAFSSAFLSGCGTDTVEKSAFQPLFFTAQEHQFLKEFLDFLLPKTDSPSATEVGVDQMIDAMIANVYSQEKQVQARKELNQLMTFFDSQYSRDMNAFFEACERIPEEENEVIASFKNLKQQGVSFYLSTEVIAKNYLNYLPIPGEYQACISLEEAENKMWAL